MQITAEARYELHRRAHRRILADLGTSDGKLNQKLTMLYTHPTEQTMRDAAAEMDALFPEDESDDQEEKEGE